MTALVRATNQYSSTANLGKIRPQEDTEDREIFNRVAVLCRCCANDVLFCGDASKEAQPNDEAGHRGVPNTLERVKAIMRKRTAQIQ